MQNLLALDLALGEDLERAIRSCVERSQAFCVLDQRLSPRRRSEQLNSLGATMILGNGEETSLHKGQQLDDEVGLVMLTSGSSGAPKAVELTWRALQESAKITQAALRSDGPPVWLPCLPACHIGGLAVILRAIYDDATLLWDDVELDTAPARGATHVAVVRAQLMRHDLESYEKVLLGGAKPPGVVPSNVVATWGMTETGSGVVYNGIPLPGVELASVDDEICVRSPTLFRSYRDAPRPRVVGPDGTPDWFPTGDAGEINNGLLQVRGRLGYVINSGGEKIWPEELEQALSLVPGVRDVAITAVSDNEWGQRVVALVVTDNAVLDEELRDAAEESVGPWAKPKEIRYVVAIPRTSNGKIHRAALEHLE